MPCTIAAPACSELLIKKSRFVGCVEPVSDRAAAQRRVAALWRAHPAASHVCWALMAGGQSAAVDDGEPSGTAGRPMLEVLRHQDLEGVLATVVRYYGGVRLGAGGLVRAYTDAVAQALAVAERVPIVARRTFSGSVPYALEGLLRRELAQAGGELLEVIHGAEVAFVLRLAEPDAEAFRERLQDAAQGGVSWKASR
ncbi:MAG: YigZ family protein [Rhodocyclaceae bacterium]|nr:YigZ family protein [Rhodocyclaceae bacterium]